jgi:ParB family chromosome partitioning protein
LPSAKPSPPPAPAQSPTTPVPQALTEPGERVQKISLDRIRPCHFQPRKDFTEESLHELAASIKEQGVVQPLLVRPKGDGFELIAGERRWRAAKLAGIETVPIIVRQANDRTVLELALIENLQRENLNPMEEAQGYSQLAQQFELTQEEIALKVGKSRAAVANALRLLQLASAVRDYVRKGFLSVGHAKVLLGVSNPETQTQLAERVLRENLSVRATEDLLKSQPAPSRSGPSKPAGATPDAHVADLQNKLKDRFGTRVLLKYRQGKGSVEIKFFNDDDLERILSIAGVSVD